MAYEWKANLACIATYKVLEGNNNLNQFEESVIPFEKAPEVTMDQLRYYPHTTNNPDLIEVKSYEIARKFVKSIVNLYSVKKEKKEMNSAEIIKEIAQIFARGGATILNLAETVDRLIKFQDE
jgi:hypothetical protein